MMRAVAVCPHEKRFIGQDRDKEKLEIRASLLSCKGTRRDGIRVATLPGRSWRIRTDPEKARMDTAPSLGSPQGNQDLGPVPNAAVHVSAH